MQSLTPIVQWAAPAQIGEAMEHYQYFIAPIMDEYRMLRDSKEGLRND